MAINHGVLTAFFMRTQVLKILFDINLRLNLTAKKEGYKPNRENRIDGGGCARHVIIRGCHGVWVCHPIPYAGRQTKPTQLSKSQKHETGHRNRTNHNRCQVNGRHSGLYKIRVLVVNCRCEQGNIASLSRI